MKARKVFLVQDIVPNYRVPVFARIAALEGVDLTVFYSEPPRAMRDENLNNAAGMEGFRNVKLSLLDLGADAAYQFGLAKYLLRERPDVVIAGGAGRPDRLLALTVCQWIGARFLWFQGGVPYRDPQKIQKYTQRGRLNRFFGINNPRWRLTQRADGMIVYSRHAQEYYTGLGFPAERIWVAPNSTDTERLQQYQDELARCPEELDELRRRYTPNGEKLVLTLGRLNRARQVDVLLESMARIRSQIPDASLLIVGDGRERAALETLAQDLALPNIHFAGAIYDDRMLARYFTLCDVFVTPGISSLAIKMAMSFGKPVVTVDYGLEVHDVADGENGFIFPMGDAQALSECLVRLFRDRTLRAAMGAASRRTIRENINVSRMVAGFADAIRSQPTASATAFFHREPS